MKRPILSTAAVANPFLKTLVHGPSNAGKTRFAATFPKPLIFDIEGGTRSVRDLVPGESIVAANNITIPDLLEYIDWAGTKEASQFETIVIDSLTHLQTRFLTENLPKVNDPRQVYGKLQQYLRELMDKLYKLNKHTVVICRSKVGEDIEGAEKLLPELAPSAFGVVPALVDLGVVMNVKTTGLGRQAVTTPTLYTQHPKYWTKTRDLLPAELTPTYTALQAALKAADGGKV